MCSDRQAATDDDKFTIHFKEPDKFGNYQVAGFLRYVFGKGQLISHCSCLEHVRNAKACTIQRRAWVESIGYHIQWLWKTASTTSREDHIFKLPGRLTKDDIESAEKWFEERVKVDATMKTLKENIEGAKELASIGAFV